MFSNYFKIALRNLIRNRSFTIINVMGLALSIACALIIFLDIQYEFSFDNFQPDKNQLARVVTDTKYQTGSTSHTCGVPLLMEQALRIEMPQLQNATTTLSQFNSFFSFTDPLSGDNKKFKQDDGIYYVEPSLFQMFNFPWLAGNPATAMSQPYSVALSESIAEKFFGDWKNAMGKTIKADNDLTLQVNGVMADPPENSSIPLKIAISFNTFQVADSGNYRNLKDWGNLSSNVNCYVQLPQNLSESDIDRLFPAFCKKYYTDKSVMQTSNHLQSFSQIHFDPNYESDVRTVRTSTLDTMLLIALFVILMACINFINLSTAMATKRSKEVGVRKVLGSSRINLIKQFFGETVLLVFAASILGVLLASLAFKFFNDLTNLPETTSILSNIRVWIYAGILIIVVSVLTASYPAFILSGFQPVLAIKSKINIKSKSGVSLRSGLVVFQFLISQVFLIATIITIRQLNYINTSDLGLNKDAVLQIPLYNDSAAEKRFDAFKNQVLQLPSVYNVSLSSDAPTSDNDWSTNFCYNHAPQDENFHVYLKFGDPDFFKTYGIQFLAGHAYAESDTSQDVVINETLMKKLGIAQPGDAIGKEIRLGGNAWKPIVGVVKDFKTNSLHSTVKPTYLSTRKKFYGIAGVKIAPQNMSETVASINKIWDHIFPEYYFESSFLDENIAQFYLQDEKMSKLFRLVAFLAVFISCLGLFGLVSFFITNRTKEVGIRKVLGASVTNISLLFLRYFLTLVGIALLIAIPVSWYLMNGWLQNFVYKIQLSWWIFGAAALLSFMIATGTVIIQIIKAAIVSPVKNLRTE